MTDPSLPAAVAVSAAGITILGIATGLHPAIMIAGFAGGLWALSYQPPSSTRWARVLSTIVSSLIAGYGAPLAAVVATSAGTWPERVTSEMLELPMAALIGFLTYTVIGPALIRISTRATDEVMK